MCLLKLDYIDDDKMRFKNIYGFITQKLFYLSINNLGYVIAMFTIVAEKLRPQKKFKRCLSLVWSDARRCRRKFTIIRVAPIWSSVWRRLFCTAPTIAVPTVKHLTSDHNPLLNTMTLKVQVKVYTFIWIWDFLKENKNYIALIGCFASISSLTQINWFIEVIDYFFILNKDLFFCCCICFGYFLVTTEKIIITQFYILYVYFLNRICKEFRFIFWTFLHLVTPKRSIRRQLPQLQLPNFSQNLNSPRQHRSFSVPSSPVCSTSNVSSFKTKLQFVDLAGSECVGKLIQSAILYAKSHCER